MKLQILTVCVFLFSSLALASIRSLKSIDDLKKQTRFGRKFPRHGLMLLYHLFQNIQVKGSAYIPNFDPELGVWGFHRFNNYQWLLPHREGRTYYIVGNLALPNARQLPQDITSAYRASGERSNPGANVERAIIEVNRNDHNRIRAVYITQHYPRDHQNPNSFDRTRTFEIHPNLIDYIRDISRSWRNSPAGIYWFLGEANYDISPLHYEVQCIIHASSARIQRSLVTSYYDDKETGCYDILLEIRTTDRGYARIRWANLPVVLLENGVKVTINENEFEIKSRSYGTADTSEYLTGNLVAKLKNKAGRTILSSPSFDDAFGKLPVTKGYVSLQLFADGGYAAARVYLANGLLRSSMTHAWVGFYDSKNDKNDDYQSWQWVSNFKELKTESHHYAGFLWTSSSCIAPGVQARFFLKDYQNVVNTPSWES